MITLSDSGQQALYSQAVSTLANGLKADRAVLVTTDGAGRLSLAGAHGLPHFSLDDAPVSVSLLLQVASLGKTMVYHDVNSDWEASNNVSLRLSGAVSVICLPFLDGDGRPAGALYADTTKKIGAFRRRELLFARDCATWLEGCLAGRKLSVPRIEPVKTPPVRSAEAVPPEARKARLPSTSVSARDLMIFFRGLATLTKAGVMITDSLAVLARSSETATLAFMVDGMARAISAGKPLSVAMEAFPKAFDSSTRAAVRVGERTGRLVRVLEVLAEDYEKGQKLRNRLRSAITYPLILAGGCSLMLLFGPPYVLAGQLRMLQSSGVPLPLLTSGLLALSWLVRQPLFPIALIALVLSAVRALRRQDVQNRLWRLSRRVPVLGNLVTLVSLTTLTRALALQLKAGLTALEAISQARVSGSDPVQAEALQVAEDGLRNGDSLSEAIGRSPYFPKMMVSFFEAGESSGTLAQMVEWVAGFYEVELESGLDRLVALAEPLIMATMGLVTLVLLVATLKPTLLLLGTL